MSAPDPIDGRMLAAVALADTAVMIAFGAVMIAGADPSAPVFHTDWLAPFTFAIDTVRQVWESFAAMTTDAWVDVARVIADPVSTCVTDTECRIAAGE